MTDGQWIDLVPVDALNRGDATPVTLNRHEYGVFDTTSGITVTDNRCTHAGAPLCDGYFDGKNIECPVHQGLFDTKTGRALASPVTRPLRTYPVRVECGIVQIYLQDLVSKR